MTTGVLAKVKKLKNWQMALIIALVGCAVFFTGVNNPFQGDDQTQIQNNLVVHSFSHVIVLFEGGTFYNGGSATTPLLGTYYRPLMMTVFSLIYTIFGAHPLYFHLIQILIVIGSAILLYLVLQHLFRKPLLSLALSLIFLVHPMNSQVAFAIPSMQDALFLFFGILAFWILLQYESEKSLWLVAGSLFLSLLSKEAGILFVIMILFYLYLFNRDRLLPFAKIVALPVILWLIMKGSAVGLFGSDPHDAPIDRLSLLGRIMTMPSIMLFYLTKFVFPWKLATQYHWVYPTFSVQHVLLPLIIDAAVITLVVLVGRQIKRRATKKQFKLFLFFAVWAGLGLATFLQLFPMDMTACENWFYFPMVGVLGMIGTALIVFKLRINPLWLALLAALVIGVLGVRTAIRGTDYHNVYQLELKDVSASKEDFQAYTGLAQSEIDQGNYAKAKTYAEKSIAIYPDMTNYQDLGAVLVYQDNYAGAYKAYESGLKYGNYSQLLDDLGQLTLVYGSPTNNQKFFANSLKQFPHDSYLWTYYALLFYRYGNVTYAKGATAYAVAGGQAPPLAVGVYNAIANNERIGIQVGNKNVVVP